MEIYNFLFCCIVLYVLFNGIRIISINSKGFKEVYYEQCIGVYAALSQPNTMRRIGEQGITIVLIEECNPEKENHPFVGNDTSKLASIIKSITNLI